MGKVEVLVGNTFYASPMAPVGNLVGIYQISKEKEHVVQMVIETQTIILISDYAFVYNL